MNLYAITDSPRRRTPPKPPRNSWVCFKKSAPRKGEISDRPESREGEAPAEPSFRKDASREGEPREGEAPAEPIPTELQVNVRKLEVDIPGA